MENLNKKWTECTEEFKNIIYKITDKTRKLVLPIAMAGSLALGSCTKKEPKNYGIKTITEISLEEIPVVTKSSEVDKKYANCVRKSIRNALQYGFSSTSRKLGEIDCEAPSEITVTPVNGKLRIEIKTSYVDPRTGNVSTLSIRKTIDPTSQVGSSGIFYSNFQGYGTNDVTADPYDNGKATYDYTDKASHMVSGAIPIDFSKSSDGNVLLGILGVLGIVGIGGFYFIKRKEKRKIEAEREAERAKKIRKGIKKRIKKRIKKGIKKGISAKEREMNPEE